ncbi:hypothetical protein ACTFIW_009715 [Dictyostelium discoideum]
MSSIEEIDTDETFTSDYVGARKDEVDDIITATTIAQKKMENSIFEKLSSTENGNIIEKKKILNFLMNGIEKIPMSHQGLDSSKVWISFWILNGMDMLDSLDSYPNISSRASKYLSILQNDDNGNGNGNGNNRDNNQNGGGFGGGNSHTSHVVSTFAAVSALYVIGTEESYKTIDREAMYKFLMRMKTKEGAFTSEDGGEYDSRTTYCAIAVASMLNILTEELERGVVDFLLPCQTYEGGFGAYPFNEAHGGYTFCSVAALSILNSLHKIDMNSLHRWITYRQSNDGGFEGRTNKLVDTCYSYWQGAVYIIIQSYFNYYKKQQDDDGDGGGDGDGDGKVGEQQEEGLLFNQTKLQEYVIRFCQQSDKKYSGFSDHPHRGKDYYHTCYGLSGISLSQYNEIGKAIQSLNTFTNTFEQPSPPINKKSTNVFTISNNNNNKNKKNSNNNNNNEDQLVEPVHPIYNIKLSKCEKGLKYFYSLNSINSNNETKINDI